MNKIRQENNSQFSILNSQLPLMEHFYTICGEGFHQGKAAYFIRLAGCDVGCVWCDVKDSWDATKYPLVDVKEIADTVSKSGAPICVITGGEPFMHDLSSLIEALHNQNIKVHIETSGAYQISGNPDWICVSPKKFKPPIESVLLKAHELKVVIFNKTDFEWAEEYAVKVSKECLLFLQPEWSKAEQVTPWIIDYVKNNPQWRISLQVHKYMNIP
ncbi:MAG: 7-carboxy-7-deazaguanine synthase QueE [Bacteroidota bacterium]